MKYPFNIYPALFIISSTQKDESLEFSLNSIGAEKASHDTKELKHFPDQPQTYFGNCIIGANQTRVTLHFANRRNICFPVLELTDSILKSLEPRTYKGKKYTFSYIIVNN
jgi:hypothetical protein